MQVVSFTPGHPSSGKKLKAHTEQEAGWTPETEWRFQYGWKPLTLIGNRTNILRSLIPWSSHIIEWPLPAPSLPPPLPSHQKQWKLIMLACWCISTALLISLKWNCGRFLFDTRPFYNALSLSTNNNSWYKIKFSATGGDGFFKNTRSKSCDSSFHHMTWISTERDVQNGRKKK